MVYAGYSYRSSTTFKQLMDGSRKSAGNSIKNQGFISLCALYYGGSAVKYDV